MKKILLVLMPALLLCSCGGSQASTSGTGSASTSETPTQTVVPYKEVELTTVEEKVGLIKKVYEANIVINDKYAIEESLNVDKLAFEEIITGTDNDETTGAFVRSNEQTFTIDAKNVKENAKIVAEGLLSGDDAKLKADAKVTLSAENVKVRDAYKEKEGATENEGVNYDVTQSVPELNAYAYLANTNLYYDLSDPNIVKTADDVAKQIPWTKDKSVYESEEYKAERDAIVGKHYFEKVLSAATVKEAIDGLKFPDFDNDIKAIVEMILNADVPDADVKEIVEYVLTCVKFFDIDDGSKYAVRVNLGLDGIKAFADSHDKNQYIIAAKEIIDAFSKFEVSLELGFASTYRISNLDLSFDGKLQHEELEEPYPVSGNLLRIYDNKVSAELKAQMGLAFTYDETAKLPENFNDYTPFAGRSVPVENK